MHRTTSEPYDQWVEQQDQWAVGPMDLRTNGPWDQWVELWDQWAVGPMGRRATGPESAVTTETMAGRSVTFVRLLGV